MRYMTTPNPRTHRPDYLTYLHNSDETIEELLSGGADIDDLIETGVLDDGYDEYTDERVD